MAQFIFRRFQQAAFVFLVGAMACRSAAVWPEESIVAGFEEVKVQRVFRDPRSGQPVALLSDPGQRRGMLIWIGEPEALALEAARKGIAHRRPLTHDLFAGVLKTLRVRLVRVQITELRDSIYYARIILDSKGERFEVDSRPSDAMVLALQAGCPILVATPLFEAQSISLSPSVLRSYGLGLQELTEDLKEAFRYHGDGVLVAQVEPDSQAERDGFQPRDILLRAAGERVRHVKDVRKAIEGASGRLEVAVYREGHIITLSLHPPESP